MTFYEAAIEVLRDEGHPLHFKKITAHAIKRNLLSHVGRTPEDTMEERLTQETKKPESDSLIRSVRPGVFTLVEGADIEEARQTVSLREGTSESDRLQSDSTEVAKKIVDQQNNEPISDSSSSSNDNRRNDTRKPQKQEAKKQDSQKRDQSQAKSSQSDRSSNQRSSSDRQSNDNRSQNNRGSSGKQSNDSRQSSDNRRHGNDDRSQNNRGSSNRQSNDSRQSSGGRSSGGDNRSQDNRSQGSRAPSKSPAATDSSSRMGDIAEHIAGLMDNSGAMTLDEIVKSMQNTTWASIDQFGPVAIRNILIHANETSGDAGQPPRFFELNNHRWTLAQASDKELGKSYDALEEWQTRHRSLLLDRLSQQLLDMSPGKLAFTVGLVMERLGYDQITDGKKVGDEIANLVGNMEQGFANERIVIRVLSRGDKANEQSVISLRGSLNLYRADRGILISLDGFDGSADQQKRVDNVAPISLVSVQEVARLMLKTNVGVCLYEVSTACMDDAFFAS